MQSYYMNNLVQWPLSDVISGASLKIPGCAFSITCILGDSDYV